VDEDGVVYAEVTDSQLEEQLKICTISGLISNDSV